jgi:hypothetical protein
LLYVFEHPLAAIDFFLNLLANALLWPQLSTFMGGPFGQHLGTVVGLMLIFLALAGLLLVYKRRRVGEYSFWISLMLYSFLILAATTVGRSERAELALAPRFTSFAILAVVSIYALLATAALGEGLSIRRPSISSTLLAVLSATVLLSAAVSYPMGIKQGRYDKAANEERAYVLSRYESQPNRRLKEISGIHNAKVVRERAPVLQRLGYNVFS